MSNCAVKFYSSDSNPDNLPSDWISRYVELGESNVLPSGFDRVMTHAEFISYREARQQAMDARHAVKARIERDVERCKAEAQRRIALIFGLDFNDSSNPPRWLVRQMNYQARFAELIEKRVAGLQLSASDRAEVDQLKALWDRVKAIRAFSNTLEARVLAGEVFDIEKEPWPS